MPSLKIITSAVAALCLCAFFFVPPSRAAARQKRRASVPYGAAPLRRALAAALGGEFEIVRDELTRRSDYHGGGAYWLAHVRPRRAGHFTLKYTYKYDDPRNRQDPLYTHVEHELSFAVGPRGCSRRPEYMAAYFQPCLGDTVILPIVLDAYKRVYTEHAFKFTVNSIDAAREGARKQDRAEASDAESAKGETIPNPLAEHLKYIGRSVNISPHRALGYTANYYVTFEAVKPGRFNLSVTGRAAAASSSPTAAPDGGDSIPVIIVERGTPVTWLASRESVRGYSERFASNSGNNYLTSPVVMQPGERLTLRYFGFSRRHLRPRDEREPTEQELDRLFIPVIARLPFRVEREREFNEWIVEHLPAPRAR